MRVGIQPFQLDFRGFLFNDQQLGLRLFGNRDNNRFQYNLMAIWRLEKDTNSGLNNVLQSPRKDWILHANLYRQDFPFVGLTSQASLTVNVNRERGDIEVDDNGFPVRPALIGNLRARNYEVAYLGYSADGRIGRINLSASAYGAFGWDRNNIFTGETGKIRSFFLAAEPSYDLNWMRFRGAFLFASGDGEPFDDHEGGFDAIFENPIFAGADTSYWIRQTIPFAGGGRAVSINGRNGILNSLRSSKEQGQSNFNNPGTILHRRRRRFRPHARMAAERQPQPPLVPQDRGPAGAAQRRLDPPRHRLGRLGCGDLAPEDDPEPRLPGLGGGAPARRRLPRPFLQLGPRQALLFGPPQRDRDLLMPPVIPVEGGKRAGS